MLLNQSSNIIGRAHQHQRAITKRMLSAQGTKLTGEHPREQFQYNESGGGNKGPEKNLGWKNLFLDIKQGLFNFLDKEIDFLFGAGEFLFLEFVCL